MTRQMADVVTSAAREDLRGLLKVRPDITLEQVSAYTSLSDSTVRNFMNGHLPGGRQVVGEIQEICRLIRAGDILPVNGSSGKVIMETHSPRARRIRKREQFYETTTVRRVAEVLDYCVEHAAIGVITADYGVGKTEAVAAWRRSGGRKVDSAVFEFDEYCCSNKVSFIQYLAELLGVPITLGSQGAGKTFRDVCDHLAEHPCLLVFDQCERVLPKVLNIIRQIWDRTGAGVVILAAPVLLARLSKSGLADLGALTARVGIWAPLAGVSRAEMAAIVKQEGVADISEDGFDLWWKATAGSMRRLMASLDMVKSKHSGKRVTEKTVAGVASHLFGMHLEGA